VRLNPAGNDPPGNEGFAKLRAFTATECDNSELTVAGDEALGADLIEKC